MDPIPPGTADELTQLRAYLETQRAVIRSKALGLDAEQLGQALAPSTMTLGGLLMHLAYVEDYWLVHRAAGQPEPQPWSDAPWEQDQDWDWHIAAGQAPDAIWGQYETSVQRGESALAETAAPGDEVTTLHDGTPANLRWVLLHLLEEYARHAGHADLVREAIDGQVG